MKKRRTTKDKVLHILKKDNEISIKDLMEYFTISEIAVRRHLNDLIRQQFIKERVVKQNIGRPYHLYSLTKKGHDTFPNQYEQLPVELLKDLEMLQGKKAVHDVLKKRKEREETELEAELTKKSFGEKIEKMAEYQEEKGYMLEYEQTAEGHYEIKNFNCPIYNLANSYGIVCANEKDMYRKIFPNSEVISHSCMTKGSKYCCWTITKPK
ncbi:helix-turn-helix transcriptional regulator [Pseudogracilibacillus auburnensis]|uniref:Transcriptional regulator n=1 Tax=Pseudogracilibacillus auburnensis TaxID=1494959 RepID=A0A2V3VN36_9BACI|nr:DeoR family transcriptional regulator [Pseudogracilibacillus auburnensis]MBO1004994.1 DeoR family transcriptional regulator [Pseudogracilibacillus auburnensis]PXW81435.1 transcriptional regulator [Pseudogracilibacillus auburnensis]